MNNEKEWYEVPILHYYDDKFETKTNLNCSICSSTNYFGQLNPIGFKFSLICNRDNLKKFIFMNLEQCLDLKRYFDKVKNNMKNLDINGVNIKRRYNKDKDLIFIFKKNEVDELMCTLRIMANMNDYLEVTFSLFPTFTSIYNSLAQFISNNIKLNVDITCSFRTEKTYENLASSLNSFNNSLNEIKMLLRKTEDDEVKETKEMKDFNNFIGEELHNIRIPETEMIERPSEKPQVTGLNDDEVSSFCSEYLKWDVNKLEEIFCNIFKKDNHIEYLNDIFVDFSKKYVVFPGITPLDEKAVLHVSYFAKEMLLYKNVIVNEIFVKEPEPIRNYYIPPKAATKNPVNISLAYDLLSIYVYMKIFRELLNLKTNSFTESKTEFMLAFTSTYLPFTVPNIFYESLPTIIREVNTRLEVFNRKLFKSYNKILKEKGFKPFTEQDIKWKVEEFYNKYIEKFKTTEEVHDEYYLNHSYILPYNNDFNLEQIKKCIVPIEVRCCPKRWDLIDDEFLNKFNCVDENIRTFLKEKKPTTHHKIKRESNLERFVNSNKDGVPKEWLSSLNLLISNITKANNDFEFYEFDYSYEELSEEILKALYCWKPSTNPKIVNNYNAYLESIEECILTKQNILDLMKNKNNNDVDKDDEINWDVFV